MINDLKFKLKRIKRAIEYLTHPNLFTIAIDYPVYPKPRWTVSDPNQPLYKIISHNVDSYKKILQQFLQYHDMFNTINCDSDSLHPNEPNWINGYLPGLDAISLYCFLCLNNPREYLEVGSGNSTKFARRAINDNQLRTKITSIDPTPRADIDEICDEFHRKPVEEIDLGLFEKLRSGDILFIDNSHRVFTNSDVTVMFLDVIPRLKPGVIIEFHDICLPYDYPSSWNNRYYSEQYMMGAYLLGGGRDIEILLPNYFVSYDNNLHSTLQTIWNEFKDKGIEVHGSSFWLTKKEG